MFNQNRIELNKTIFEVSKNLELIVVPWDKPIYVLNKNQTESLIDGIDDMLYNHPKNFSYEFEDDCETIRNISIYRDNFWFDDEIVSIDFFKELSNFLEKNYTYYVYKDEDFFTGRIEDEEI